MPATSTRALLFRLPAGWITAGLAICIRRPYIALRTAPYLAGPEPFVQHNKRVHPQSLVAHSPHRKEAVKSPINHHLGRTMGIFTNPTSFRLNAIVAGNEAAPSIATRSLKLFSNISARANNHDSHPPLGHLILLVFEAVMEVVCVSLPGYIVARQGMFDADNQKFVANLNVALFTPCLSMCNFIHTGRGEMLIGRSLHKVGVAIDCG